MKSQMTFQTKTHQLTKTSMQRKKILMLQITMCLIYQYIHNSYSQTLWEIDMEICLYSQHHTSNLMKVYVQLYLWTEDNNCTKMKSEAYDLEGNNMWF